MPGEMRWRRGEATIPQIGDITALTLCSPPLRARRLHMAAQQFGASWFETRRRGAPHHEGLISCRKTSFHPEAAGVGCLEGWPQRRCQFSICDRPALCGTGLSHMTNPSFSPRCLHISCPGSVPPARPKPLRRGTEPGHDGVEGAEVKLGSSYAIAPPLRGGEMRSRRRHRRTQAMSKQREQCAKSLAITPPAPRPARSPAPPAQRSRRNGAGPVLRRRPWMRRARSRCWRAVGPGGGIRCARRRRPRR